MSAEQNTGSDDQDIVSVLRRGQAEGESVVWGEAADEIERLRRENDAMRSYIDG